jgi:hypothetical protein
MAKDARIQGVGEERCAEKSPAAIFARIRNELNALGVLGSTLSLEYRGATYRISCDDKAFMVYRINSTSASRHHVPGWPVCLVNSDSMFQECCSDALSQDHYACDLDIESWIELISRYCRGL